MFKRLLVFLFFILSPLLMKAQIYLMGNSSISTCGGTFYDSGGAGANYSNNENSTITFCSANAGSCIKLQFTSFDTELGLDFITIYDGPNTSSTLLGVFTGTTLPGAFTSSTGCITINFQSDATVKRAGWEALISCVNCSTGGCAFSCSGGPAPANDACSGASSLGNLPAPLACPNGIGLPLVMNATNLCATAESPYSSLLGCQPAGSMAAPAADVWYTFSITGPTLNVNIAGMQTPNIGLYEGNSCANLVPRGCAIGTGGALSASFSGLAAGQYYLQVSGGSLSDQCNFVLTLQNNFDCSGCVIQSNLTATPPPVNGSYQAGQTVTFCYTITDYNQTSANWLHGVVPNFGPGWNLGSLTTSAAASCSGAGTWSWYNTNITSSATGNVTGPGFYFESALGGSGLDGNPGNNYGDNNGANTCDWTFCWTVTTLSQANCIQGASLNIGINTLGDGESGSWTSLACTGDPVTSFFGTLSCCPAPNVNVNNPNCSTGLGNANAQGQGISPWDYVWKNSSGTVIQTANNVAGANAIANLAPGNYIVTVTDNSGCTASAAFSIVAPPALSVSLAVTDVLCRSASNGTATATPNGGTPGYSYTWSPAGVGAVRSNLAPGNYTVTVTDANGCTANATAIINQPNNVTSNITSVTNVSCNGGNDGAAVCSPGGGTPGYTFLWSNGTTGSTISGLTAGNYSLTVTDINGCTGTAGLTIIEPAPMNLILNATSASCGNSNGTASVIVGGGTPGYTYNWSPTGGVASNASGLPAGGYTVTVSDAKGCTSIGNVSVPNSSGPTASIASSIDVSCNGGNNGSATAAVVGGPAPYTYQWSPSGGSSVTASGLSAGSYTVTITDNTGCSSSASVIISEPTVVIAQINSTVDASCNGVANGSATVTTSGGTPGYTYLWNNGNVTSTDAALAAGNYTVTVTDSRGCTAQTNTSIAQPSVLNATINSATDVTCYSGTNGALTAGANGGTAPYTYEWSTGTTGASLSGIIAGIYTVTVTDANGCTAVTQSGINEPAQLIAFIASSTDVSCYGAADGIATIGINGGTTPYSIAWNPNVSSGLTATGLAGGNYSITILDANGCNTATAVIILEPSVLNISQDIVVNVSCNGLSDGSASVIANDGTPAYSYAWSPSVSTGVAANNLSAGNYTVTVTDANGCTNAVVINVTQPLPLTVGITVNTPASCNLSTDGALTALAADGTGPYSYVWSDGSSADNINGLTAGTYTVTATDANGCSSITQGIITEPNVVTALLNTVPATCGASNGSADVISGGGTPGYTYLWSSGGTLTSEPGLSAGTYTVTVTDANGCTAENSISVQNTTGPQLTVNTVTDVSCFGGTDGTAAVNVNGGALPYVYQWSSGGSGPNETGLSAGTFTVTVTDANSCTTSIAVTINEPSILALASGLITNVSCNGGTDGSAEIIANGGTPNYTYLWSNGDITPIAGALSAGTFNVTVTDANGCTAQQALPVVEPLLLTVGITVNTPASCNLSTDGALTALAKDGTAPYSYVWSDGSSLDNISGTSAGTYTVTVTDANGCTAQIQDIITEPTPLTAVMNSVAATCGASNGSGDVIAGGGTPGYTYLWSSGGTAFNETGLTSGTYTVTVTDANGCTLEDFTNVQNTSGPQLSINVLTDVSCFAGTDGTASVSINAGTAPYTYQWSTGVSITAQETNLASGNYTVTVTDANSCSASLTFNINQPSPIVLNSGIINDVTCNGGNNGSAEVIANGATPGYTYLWSNGDNSPIANNLVAGNYSVTVTDANGCSAQMNAVVIEPQNLTAGFILIQQISCFGGNDGATTIDPSGGTLPYNYLWSNGNLTSTINAVVAGNYSVTVTDANGCSVNEAITLTEPTLLQASIASQQNVTCNGGTDGSAILNVSGGTAGYSFQWSPSGGNASSAVNLNAGAYVVTVTDANGCSVIVNIQITEPPTLNLSIASNTSVFCFGGSDGSIALNTTGGSPSFSYQWSAGGSVTSSAFLLSAGNYTVTVTDANGCSTSITESVTEPSALQANINITDAFCNGGSSGSLEAIVNGGTPAYLYSWFPGGANTAIANSLIAGNYTVTITDLNGCTLQTAAQVNEPASIQLNTASTPATCGTANGTISVVANGGAGAYTYDWNSGTYSTAVVNGVAAGNYQITVTDANGCTSNANVSVNSLGGPTIAISSSTDVNCFGGNDGSATVNVINGNGPYSFNWSPSGGSGLTATNLATGNYGIAVTDVNGCTASTTVTINEPSQLTALANSITAHCSQSDGSVTVQENGGVGPYSYLWSGGEVTATVNSLSAGNYTVTVTDSHNCTATSITTISNAPSPNLIVNSSSDALCFGAASGAALITANGGSTPYQFLWSNGNITAQNNGLIAGNYTATVTDNAGCTATTSVVIAEPTAIVLNTSSTTATCGSSNGSAEVIASGGTSPYSYNWSSGNVTAIAGNLAAGNYTVTVTDANNCSDQINVIVSNAGGPVIASGPITNVTCFGGTDGDAAVNMVSGSGPFTYSWFPSGGNASTATNLSAGTYTVTATDLNGCSTSLNLNVVEPTELLVSAIATDVACAGGADGTVTIDALGATSPYTYDWNPGGVLSANRINLSAGNYTVTVTDVNGCSADVTVQVNEPLPVVVNAVIADVDCNGNNNGAINLNPIGGIAPYTYLWSNGNSGVSSTNLSAGTYTVTVSDNNGCSAVITSVVNEPSAIVIQGSFIAATCGTSNGSANALVNGGTGTYNYLWSTGGTTALETGLIAANYTVTVTDQAGCSQSAVINVPNAGGPVVSITATTDLTCNGDNSGAASVNVSSGNGPFSYNWIPNGGSSASASALAAGNYTVNVTDINGCQSAVQIQINEPSALSANVIPTAATCGNANGSAIAQVNGGTSGYTYVWSTGSSVTNSINAIAPGNYTLTVTDAVGCFTTTPFLIGALGGPSVNVASVNAASCFGIADGNASVNVQSGNAPYTYSWFPTGGNTASAQNLAGGNYSVTVTDVNGCGTPINITIAEPSALQLNPSSLSSTCNASNGSVEVLVSGGNGNYNYQWSDGSVTSQVSNLPSGTYTVTVTDLNGCSASVATQVASAPGPISAITNLMDVSCFGGTNGSAQVNISNGTAPFSYNWSGGSIISSASNLIAGNYTVMVTDANGCTSISPFVIQEPVAIQLNTGTTTASCGAANGGASVFANGGTGTYSYSWSNGNQTSTLNAVPAGNYSVIVTDQNACTATTQVNIPNAGGPSLNLLSVNDVTCFGGSNGQAVIQSQGGSGTLNYAWSSGSGNTTIATGLTAGNYTATVTDANGCVANVQIAVNQPTPIIIAVATNPANCNSSNGAASVNVNGGTGTYTYSWNTGSINDSIFNLVSGNYSITVTDQAGCTEQSLITVPGLGGPQVAITTLNDVQCAGGNDGSATVAVSTGNGPYAYTWYPTGGNNTNAQNLISGNYTVTVTDVNGCSSIQNILINEPIVLTTTASVLQQVSCFNGNNGQASAVVNGGTLPYQYLWTGGNNTATLSNAGAGTYSLTITDAHGCIAQSSVQITQPAIISLTNVVITPVNCFGENNGTATANFAGGVLPYTYVWSNGNVSSPTAQNLLAGNYSVTVLDANGCTLQSSMQITQPTLLQLPAPIIQDANCYSGIDGSAIFNASGSVAPYAYNWSNGAVNASNNNLPAGNYTVTVTDANGCSTDQSFVISQPNQLTLLAVVADVTCFGQSTGGIQLIPGGGVTPYTVLWNGVPSVTMNLVSLKAGTYTATVIDAHSCQITATWSVDEPDPIILTLATPPVLCIGQSTTLNAVVYGGTPGYTYQWSNGVNVSSQTVSPLITTGYVVTVTDANGCSALPQPVNVTVNPPLSINLSVSSDTICEGESVSLVSLGSGGNGGPYTYVWNNLPGNVAQQVIQPGATNSYQVTVTDGCGTPSAQLGQQVVVNPLPLVSFTPVASGCAPVAVQFTSTSQTTLYSTYNWNFGDQNSGSGVTAAHTYVEAGTYSVTLLVTNNYGCSASLTNADIIHVYPNPVAGLTADPVQTTLLMPEVNFSNLSYGASVYQWNFGDGSALANEYSLSHTYQDTGVYQVELIVISNYGCRDTAYEIIHITPDMSIYIPNAFSPNNDLKNEFFQAYGIGIQKAHYLIYDRWGKIIFAGASLDDGWNGTYQSNGNLCPEGVYVYLFKITGFDGIEREYSGRVTLIR